MSTGDEVFRQIQRQARADATRTGKPTPTGEYLTRHALECFLARLLETSHGSRFGLKGGILLAAYNVRRSTKDVDSEAVDTSVTPDHVNQIAHDVIAVSAEDGVVFDPATVKVQEIREDSAYTGVRMRVKARVAASRVTVAWDVSTGDPIVPPPQLVTVPRLLGGEIQVLAFAPEATIAEKGVTILERGVASTRWRDYVDIVQLDEKQPVDRSLLRDSARAVAAHRGVKLGPVAPVVSGYGDLAQAKWAAWRRKEHLEATSEARLDDQMTLVARVLDPAFEDDA